MSDTFLEPNTGRKDELFGHPKGLYVLFFTEMWERFAFYSMRAFLVLYLTQAMLVSQEISNEIYGAYLGFVYAAPFIGGMLADHVLGQRRAITIGGFLFAAGHFSLAVHALQLRGGAAADGFYLNVLFFGALGLVAAGNGFFKPNISSIVGSLYSQNDSRRDGAFTIFYMGINIGAFLASFSGQAAESYGWHWGFLAAGTGMLVGQFIFFAGGGKLMGKGLPPRPGALTEARFLRIPNGLAILAGVGLFVPVAALLMAKPSYVQNLALIVAIPIVLYLFWEISRATREEAGRMFVILVLCGFAMMFWAFFELAGSAVNLFTLEKVDRTFMGKELGASLLTASINPFFIILLSLPFAKLWVWLDKKRMEPSSPLKFALGLTQLGLGFFLFYLGAVQAGEDGKCSMLFLVFGFFLHTTGELCLSPVGLSTMTKLSPIRMVSTFMGVWFLASSLGNIFGGWVGGRTEHAGFGTVFFWIFVVSVASGALLFLLTPILKRMMHGVK